jgi:hypothetical protein
MAPWRGRTKGECVVCGRGFVWHRSATVQVVCGRPGCKAARRNELARARRARDLDGYRADERERQRACRARGRPEREREREREQSSLEVTRPVTETLSRAGVGAETSVLLGEYARVLTDAVQGALAGVVDELARRIVGATGGRAGSAP